MRSNARRTAALEPSRVRSAESHEHASVPPSCLFSLCVSITLTSQFIRPCVPLIVSSCLSLLTHLHHLCFCHISFRFPSIFFLACKNVFSPKALCPVFLFCHFFVMSFFLAHYFQTSLVYFLNWCSPNINNVHLSCYKKYVLK